LRDPLPSIILYQHTLDHICKLLTRTKALLSGLAIRDGFWIGSPLHIWDGTTCLLKHPPQNLSQLLHQVPNVDLNADAKLNAGDAFQRNVDALRSFGFDPAVAAAAEREASFPEVKPMDLSGLQISNPPWNPKKEARRRYCDLRHCVDSNGRLKLSPAEVGPQSTTSVLRFSPDHIFCDRELQPRRT
jgi:hypothetical protein